MKRMLHLDMVIVLLLDAKLDMVTTLQCLN
nr:MAG TPA: hypothetical protein [Bacteriophage sp.]